MNDTVQKTAVGRKDAEVLQGLSSKSAKDNVKYTEMPTWVFVIYIQNKAGGCIYLMQSCGWNTKFAICDKEGC